jgi:hypothetical protein
MRGAVSKLACLGRQILDKQRPVLRRNVAAGSATFPPPDRSGTNLPWAISSVPARWRRVNQAALAVGTLAVAGACLKIANAGFCPPGPKLAIAVLLVEEPRIGGGPGMPVKLIELPTKARNAVANRPDAVASVNGSEPLLRNRRPQHLPSSRRCR